MITIEAQTIYDKVVEFTSFEAGRGVEDESLYNTIIVTSRDKSFIQSYALQAMTLLGSLLKFCIEDVTTDEDGNYTFLFREDCKLSKTEAKAKRLLTDAMVSSVMSSWLSNKIPERAKAYAAIHTDMASLIVNSAERIRPNLKD